MFEPNSEFHSCDKKNTITTEEQLVRGLVFQHLKTVAPSLTVEFRDRHNFTLDTAQKHLMGDIQKKVGAISSLKSSSKVEDGSGGKQEENNEGKNNTCTTEEQLVRGLIHEHMKTVAPTLAEEFQNTHLCCSEAASEHLLGELQKKVLVILNSTGINQVGDENGGTQEQKINTKKLGRKKLGVKPKTFSIEELVRIKMAMANDEDIGTVAKEMGRTYHSVHHKMLYLRRSASLKKGKFSAEEIERMKQALENNEDYTSIAAELGRMAKSVHNKMLALKANAGTQSKISYTFNEDICILDRIERMLTNPALKINCCPPTSNL